MSSSCASNNITIECWDSDRVTCTGPENEPSGESNPACRLLLSRYPEVDDVCDTESHDKSAVGGGFGVSCD